MRLPTDQFMQPSADVWNTDKAGSQWSREDDLKLRGLIAAGFTADAIAKQLSRTRVSILSRLMARSILKRNTMTGNYSFVEEESPTMNPDTACKSSTETNHPLIETRIYVNGRIAADMTDEQIFSAIRAAESKIVSYKDIVSKPEKLKALLAKMQEEITELVKYVDSRK